MMIKTPKTLQIYWDKRNLAVFCWSYATGIPLLLFMSTLAARLYENHLSLEKIGFFGLVTLPYALKVLYAPLIEHYSIPFLSSVLGRARAWMLLAMLCTMIGLVWMAMINPSNHVMQSYLFVVAFITCFCAATFDIAEAEVRIELFTLPELGVANTCYSIGYRLGMITASGGALLIAGVFNWQVTYIVMALLMFIGIIAVVLQKHNPREETHEKTAFSLKNTLHAYIKPIQQFFTYPAAIIILLLVIFYLASDEMLTNMFNPFLLSIGYSKTFIGGIIATYGVAVMLIVSFISGFLLHRFGYIKMLLSALLVFSLPPLILCIIAWQSTHISFKPSYLLIVVIICQQIAVGLGNAAYATMQAHYCRKPYTASQNAMLTSVMAGAKAIIIVLSGFIAEHLDWLVFFIIVALAVLPGIGLTLYLRKQKSGAYA